MSLLSLQKHIVDLILFTSATPLIEAPFICHLDYHNFLTSFPAATQISFPHSSLSYLLKTLDYVGPIKPYKSFLSYIEYNLYSLPWPVGPYMIQSLGLLLTASFYSSVGSLWCKLHDVPSCCSLLRPLNTLFLILFRCHFLRETFFSHLYIDLRIRQSLGRLILYVDFCIAYV